MPLVVFELAVPASERPLTHALDRAAAGIGTVNTKLNIEICIFCTSFGLGQGGGGGLL
jgi:hypothetical protein